ncbi:site-2 protease family protein [Chloroflexota bacterium]
MNKIGKLFNLGSIFGIQFQLHFTWFIIFILVTILLVYPDFSQWLYWLLGIITSLLFFASVIAHELAHSLVGRANGIPINRIVLFIFGGVAQMSEEVTNYNAELKMAVAGPACSLVIGGLFGLLWFFFHGIIVESVTIMILWLAIMNTALAVFNLIPGFPLDGGRVLRSLLWRFSGNYNRSTRIAARIGQGVGYLFILAGILIIFLHPFDLSWFDGIWLAFIGWFITSAASASYREVLWQEALRRTASQVTIPESSVTSPDITD